MIIHSCIFNAISKSLYYINTQIHKSLYSIPTTLFHNVFIQVHNKQKYVFIYFLTVYNNVYQNMMYNNVHSSYY